LVKSILRVFMLLLGHDDARRGTSTATASPIVRALWRASAFSDRGFMACSRFVELPTLNVFIRYEAPSYKAKVGDAFKDIAQRLRMRCNATAAVILEACEIGC
jgi:hypothetical protein